MTSYALQAMSAFAAGIGTSLSPCIYPMIPITIGFLGSTGSTAAQPKGKILAFFFGQVITFTSLGVVAVLLGEILGFTSEMPFVQIATGVLLLLFAYASFFEKIPAFLYRTTDSFGRTGVHSIMGAFLVGASSAAVASPCTSPVVGAMLATVSQIQERAWGIFLMFLFSVGLSFLFLAIGLGLTKVSRLPRSGPWMKKVHKGSSVLLGVGGVYFVLKGFGLF